MNIPINYITIDKIKSKSWLLLLPLFVGLFLSSCGDSPVEPQTETSFTDSSSVNTNIDIVPDKFDAVGTIQGTAIDKATGKALSDVAVSLYFNPADAEEPSVITDTTGSEGMYSFSGVPVNTDAENYLNSEEPNSPYTLKITTEELDNYRDLYRMNAPLSFESTGGDGAATNLVSDVTIPLSEQAVTLMGKAHTSNDAVLGDVKVKLYQENFNPIINGDNMTETDMLVDSTTTGSDGSFEFTGVEEKSDVMLKFIDDSDPSQVINHNYTINDLPSADGSATPKKDVGVIQVSSSNQSGAFYVASVKPEPGSDVTTDTVFSFEFNRPVADNEYNRTDLGFGNGTIIDDIQFDDRGRKKAPGDVEFSASFSSDMTTLTVDPDEGTLADATEYELEMYRAFQDDNFVDEYGNGLSWGASEFAPSDVQVLDFSTNDNNQKPHTPTLAVDSTSLNTDWNSGSHDLSWSVDDSPSEVKEYELFISKNGTAYKHLVTVPADNARFSELEYDLNGTRDPNFEYVNTSNAQRVIVNDTNLPDEANSYEVKARAISANLVEGEFSDPITFEDVTQPQVLSANYPGSGDQFTVSFNEPMNKSDVETTSSYSFDGNPGITIESAEYNASNGTVTITVEDGNNVSGGQTVIVENVSDLTGNGIDTDNNNDRATY